VPEQRLLSPKICLRWRRRCRTVLEILPIDLGFSVGRLLIGEGASSGVEQGLLTTGGRGCKGILPFNLFLVIDDT
jgi:hypothetical protein